MEKKRWLRLCNRGLEGELEEKEVEEDPLTRELGEVRIRLTALYSKILSNVI